MSDDFDFSAFVSDNPNLLWALEETQCLRDYETSTLTSPTASTVIAKFPVPGEEGEQITVAMSPSSLQRRTTPPSVDVTPRSGEEGEQIAVAMSPSSLQRRTTPPSVDVTPRSELHFSPSKSIDTGLGDLDAKSALFLAKHLSPPKLYKPHVQKQEFSSVIDPHAVGEVATREVLRDRAQLMRQQQRDEQLVGRHRPRSSSHCDMCDVTRHPSWWPQDRIHDIHCYSYLLDCQESLLKKKTAMVCANRYGTLVVYKVPMNYNNAVKRKAEDVLRFIDVEVGYGDQTCYNLSHYVQPYTREALMAVSHNRVVGIVVAEELESAHRILHETVGFMELEEESVPVRIGINRLWVHISMRRRHLATLLCKLMGRMLLCAWVQDK